MGIQSGAVIFCHNKPSFSIGSLITSRIRSATDSFWNHVAIVGDNGKSVYEIHYGGVRKTDIAAYLSQEDVIFNIVIPIGSTATKRTVIDRYLEDLYGRRKEIQYDTLAILKIRWHLFLYGDTVRIKMEDDSFLICSEFVQWALLKCGFKNSAFKHLMPYISTPESLRKNLFAVNITQEVFSADYIKKIPGGAM